MNEGLFIVSLIFLSGYVLYTRFESTVETGRVNVILNTIIDSSDKSILELRNTVKKLTLRLNQLENS